MKFPIRNMSGVWKGLTGIFIRCLMLPLRIVKLIWILHTQYLKISAVWQTYSIFSSWNDFKYDANSVLPNYEKAYW